MIFGGVKMSKDREVPCIYYESHGTCKKGRDASHKGYCQKCDKYYPRAKIKQVNKKRVKLEKITKKDGY